MHCINTKSIGKKILFTFVHTQLTLYKTENTQRNYSPAEIENGRKTNQTELHNKRVFLFLYIQFTNEINRI